MQEKELVIENKAGLHARPAALFVQTANKFESRIMIARGSRVVNGKSIMGIMMLAAEKGTRIIIKTEGSDEEEAVRKLEKLVLNKFDEE